MGANPGLQRVAGAQGSDGAVNWSRAGAVACKARNPMVKFGPNMAALHGRGRGMDRDGVRRITAGWSARSSCINPWV